MTEKNAVFRNLVALSLFLGGIVATGCGLVAGGLQKNANELTASSETVSAVSISGVSAFQVFSTSFYPFAVTNCAQCHGVSQVPLFALSDASAAYANAKSTRISRPPVIPPWLNTRVMDIVVCPIVLARANPLPRSVRSPLGRRLKMRPTVLRPLRPRVYIYGVGFHRCIRLECFQRRRRHSIG